MGRPQFSSLSESTSQAAERQGRSASNFGTESGLGTGSSRSTLLLDNSGSSEPKFVVSAAVALVDGTFSNDVRATLTVRDSSGTATWKDSRNPPATNWDPSADVQVPPGGDAFVTVLNDSGSSISYDLNLSYRSE
jgi:hypothetical protein